MKTILVLGGTSDIGIAIARRFAQEKFTVLLAGRDAEYLTRIATDINIRAGTEVKVYPFDAVDFDSHGAFYQSLDPQPDVCLCVFGYLGDQRQAEIDWDEAQRIINVNYKGAVSILNIVAEDFAADGSGTIIGVSSVAGDRGRQSNYMYGSAKAGFSAYLAGMRNRLHHKGVHVLTVKPGFVDTRMTGDLSLPSRLTAAPRQVARTVFNAYRKRRNVIYTLPSWQYIMLVIRLIPEFIFKRLKL